MLLKSIHVKNFRSIQNEILHCDNLTALVGKNNSGKSSFLKAIELFQSTRPQIDKEDWYGGNTETEITISITFNHLSDSAISLFEKYIEDDTLTVMLIFTWHDDKSISNLHGLTLQNKDFVTFFSKTNATDAKSEYDKLIKNSKYKNFGSWSNYNNVKKKLADWQDNHPDECCRLLDSGNFFGYSEVAKGYLGRFIRFFYVPAVRDAIKDTEEGNDSNLTVLLDTVIRKNFDKRKSTKQFLDKIKENYDEIITNSNAELKELQTEMTNIFHEFIPNTQIILSWKSFNEPDIIPRAGAEFEEDDHQYAITRMGHGLQRSFIMTMLQYLAEKQSHDNDPTPQSHDNDPTPQSHDNDPTLVFLIEEPELYQHPNRQRHMANTFFSSINNENSVSGNTQIIYSTHSPYFVGIDIIDQIRLLRKISPNDGNPNETKIHQTNLQEIVEELSIYVTDSSKFTTSGLKARIQTIMTPWMNEGFFSDVVVLVEGEADRAALLGCAKSMNLSFEHSEISVIPCFAKTNLLKQAVLFKKLGIKIYVMWDNDRGKTNAFIVNRQLLSLFRKEKEDYPSCETENFACLEENLEHVLENEIGKELFEKYLDKFKNEVDMCRDEARKKPYIISQVMLRLKKENKSCKKIEEIVQHIFNLKNSTSEQFNHVDQ